jgi:hypothetical protein
VQGASLEAVSVHRDLGVLISDSLSPAAHIDSIVASSNRAFFGLFRLLKSRDPKVLWRAFTVYVRPILESSSVVFHPSQANHCWRLERIQRRATKIIFLRCGLDASLSYIERCAVLNCKTLEYRRLEACLCKIKAIALGVSPAQCSINFSVSRTRGHAVKIQPPSCHSFSSVRTKFLTYRITPIYGKLPVGCANAVSMEAFKQQLAMCDLSTLYKFVVNEQSC